MANSLLTISMITRQAVRLFRNSNAFIQNINKQYSSEFGKDGAQIGTTLRIRLPNDFTVTDGPAFSGQNTAEQSTTLAIQYQRHVDLSFSSVDMTLSLQDFSERILEPAMNNLGGNVASTIMGISEGGVSNFVSNVDGGGAIISPTSQTVLSAGALLSKRSAQMMDRNLVVDPNTMAGVLGTMQGLFNPVADISKQYRTAQIYRALNFRWFEDQTVLVHTTGTFTAGTVNGADQTGTTLVTNAITGTFNQGDIINIAGVNAVNRVTKATDGVLQQFVVTADVSNGATSIPIYPAIIAPASSGPSAGAAVQYQTCASAPANAAAISLVNTAGETYRKNIAYVPQAVTMATADLKLPEGGQGQCSRAVFDGISMRIIKDYYLPGTDQFVSRADCLFGALWVRPEWGCIVADAL